MSHDNEQENAREIEAALDAATQNVAIEAARLADLEGAEGSGEPIGIAHLMDVPVKVTVEVGRRRLPLAELARLAPGSLIVLDREAHEPADILVNGKVVGRGEIVMIDGAYGVRVCQVLRSSDTPR